jgi:predicted nucleotidyltransferase
MRISNPNQIVDALITDYKSAFGDFLHSVVLYGSALSHEYVPGKSDINVLVILTDSSPSVLKKSFNVHKYWLKRGVATPFFMTPHYIKSSLDSYPVEFLNIQCNYKVLYGDDIIKGLAITRENIRLQCERDLKGVMIHLKKEFLRTYGKKNEVIKVLEISLRRLLPLLRAILILHDRKIPSSKSEIISAIEDVFGFGASVLSDVYLKKSSFQDHEKCFNEFVKTADMMIQYIDGLSEVEKIH